MRHTYKIQTEYEHIVADYAGISLQAVRQLNLLDYMILRKDAVINLLSRTESGIEYLNEAWAHEQTAPDREALRKEFGTLEV